MLNQIKLISIHRISKLILSTFIIACIMNRVGSNSGNNAKEVFTSVAEMSSVFVPRLKGMLKDSIEALSPSVSFEEEDETALATTIFESMYTPGRVYHSMNHVFNITEHCHVEHNPILVLSVLYHDIIYYSVDKIFQQSQLELLEGVLVFEDNNDEAKDGDRLLVVKQPLALASNAQEDPIIDMVVRLFGLEAGKTLPSSGTNEFLSAIIGVRVVSKWLSHPHLIQLAACIEGTVPFRPPSSDGKTAMDRLYDRLVIVAPNQSEGWLVETTHLAATMANCDMSSFDSFNFDFFMDSNWSLIPEFRPSILQVDCPLREYYEEFLVMEGRTKFLLSAVPNIFQVFRDVPSEKELSAKQDKARANLYLVNDYAQVRRLQLMVLMELVAIVGEDSDTIPGRPFLNLELPETRPYSEDEEDEVRKLLDNGRRAIFPWDPVRCSMGTFLYDRLGKKGVNAAVDVGKNKESGSYALLNHLPNDIIDVIASSVADVLPGRSDMLSQFSDNVVYGEKVMQISSDLLVSEKVTCSSSD